MSQQHELSKKVEEANHTLGDFENAKRKESLREREIVYFSAQLDFRTA